MTDVSTWDPLDANNNLPPPDGWPEFMLPAGVNNCGRMMMGAVRRMYDKLNDGTQTLPYLKLVGGQTVTGAVTFSAGISTTTFSASSNANISGALGVGSSISGASVNASGNVIAGAGVYAANTTSFGFYRDGGTANRLFLFDAATYLEFVNATASLDWILSGAGLQWRFRQDGFCYAARNSAGGNGDYVNLSDRRTKESIEPATVGLAEVLQLEPVRFQRRGHPGEWELGFVAQDVQDALPEAVRVAGVELPDGTGGLGDPEPTLGLTSGAIVAALVAAMKTIDARLTALEGGV